MPPERKIKSATLKKNDSPRSPVLVLLYAIFVSVCIYSFTFVATVDPDIEPFGLPGAVALGIVVFLFGFANADQSQKGYMAIALSVLPRLYHWSAATSPRKFAAVAVLFAGSAAVYAFGPYSVTTYSIACDEANKVRLLSGKSPEACGGALTKSLWLTPWVRREAVSLTCLDAKQREWMGRLNQDHTGACGARPLDASYVTNGIEMPALALDTVPGRRTFEGIHRLRRALAEGAHAVPSRQFNDRLLFATWNIRNLGEDRFRYGERTDESYAYIAEIISHFDVVAIQEVNDRKGVDKILSFLGGNYAAELGFTSPGSSGNRERQGFIYDARKISLGELSSTLVIDTGDIVLPGTGQPARPPFIAEFRIASNVFLAASAHIYYGALAGERYERRLAELRAMARGVRKSVLSTYPDHLSLLAGDLNTPSPAGREFAILAEEGYVSDDVLSAMPSDFAKQRTYDQIMILKELRDHFPFGRVGVFPVFDLVYRDEEDVEYKIEFQRAVAGRAEISDRRPAKAYEIYRTFQMSDHLPKWAEFQFPANDSDQAK